MNAPKLPILILTMCLGAAIGIAFFTQGVAATELPRDNHLPDTTVDHAIADDEPQRGQRARLRRLGLH